MIIVWGRVEAKAGNFDEVRRLSLEHVRRSRTETGCIHHSVLRDVENPNALVFYEQWNDRAALQAHFQVAESGQFVAALRGLVEGEPAMKIYSANLAS